MSSVLYAARVQNGDAVAERWRKRAESRDDAELFLVVCRQFAAALADVPAPEAAIANFERLVDHVAEPERWLRYLADQPRALEILVKLFVGSQHLTDFLIREPQQLQELTQQKRLADVKIRDDFLAEASQAIAGIVDPNEQTDRLRRYQRRELLRISAADTFNLLDLRATTGQLSKLAEAIIDVSLEIAANSLRLDPASLAVLALGKLGGGELNYSSDIDLILLADSTGPELVSLGQQLIRNLADNTSEGFLYRVDLRLRPWGVSGPLVTSPAAYLGYLARNAALWEKQALLKARVVAGDAVSGRIFLDEAQALIYTTDDAELLRGAVRGSKQKIEAESRSAGHDWGDVKSGAGSLRDIEFVVQYLQLRHGGRTPAVRTPNTLEALIRLTDAECLTAADFRQLTDGYIFLRTVEHALQLRHNQQRHAVPTDPLEQSYLARRLDFPDAAAFLTYFARHQAAIRDIYQRYLEQDRPALRAAAPSPLKQAVGKALLATYDEYFTAEEQARHRELLAETSPTHPVRVAAEADGENYRVTVVGDDRPGDLSMTCGLFFVYGFDIVAGFVSTAVRAAHDAADLKSEAAPQRIFVNTFIVRPPYVLAAEVWKNYENDLNELFVMARRGEAGAAQGRLAKRVADALVDCDDSLRRPQPMRIEFQKHPSQAGTILRLRADDSQGFLYELTNALALCEIDIKTMLIRTRGNLVEDTLLVTDARTSGELASDRRWQELRAAIVLIKQFTHLLPRAPNPEAALLHFRHLIADLFRQPNWVEELASLDRPEVLEALARVLGVSDFLWDDMLRLQYANLSPLLKDLSILERSSSRDELQTQLWSELQFAATAVDRRRVLNEFKDREMFRVDMRHILGRIKEFRQFAEELADIAEVVVATSCRMCLDVLHQRYGTPRLPDGTICRHVVAALGKCGGRELGFASDIELLFVYEADGQTDGPHVISNSDFFVRLADAFTASIQARQEGIFRIDLRMRPHGRSGNLASSLAAFESYFAPFGPAWPYERQALVKLRPVAGDDNFGRELVELRNRILYINSPPDWTVVQAIRERQVRQLVRAGTFQAKLSPGGLVDVEYLVQLLQLEHGHGSADLRTTSTSAAVAALHHAGHLSAADHEQLQAAYWFLRRLIDALRMVRGNAQDLTVPSRRSEEFEFLARRLGYGGDSSRLAADIESQQQTVLALLRRYQK